MRHPRLARLLVVTMGGGACRWPRARGAPRPRRSRRHHHAVIASNRCSAPASSCSPLDVTALDGEGRQVTDLTPAELMVVEVDGRRTQGRCRPSSWRWSILGSPVNRLSPSAKKGGQITRPLTRATDLDPYRLVQRRGRGARPPDSAADQSGEHPGWRGGPANHRAEARGKFIDALQAGGSHWRGGHSGPGTVRRLHHAARHGEGSADARTGRGMARVGSGAGSTSSMTEADRDLSRTAKTPGSRLVGAVARMRPRVVGVYEAERCEREIEQQASEFVSEMRQQAAARSISAHAGRAARASARSKGSKHVILGVAGPVSRTPHQ